MHLLYENDYGDYGDLEYKTPDSFGFYNYDEFMSDGLDPLTGTGNNNNKMHLDTLISFDPHVMTSATGSSTGMMLSSSPISSPGLMSPPSTANTQVETRIFQFPPAGSAHVIKQEDWVSGTSASNNQQLGLAAEFCPTSEAGGQNQQQCSPMAISPSLSTLNTPRGSITSMRSQQSPMNTDQGQPTGTGNAAGQTGNDPMMSYEPFDACTTAFVSYTTVHSNTFPSPPRSPTVTSSSAHYEGQGQGHQHQYEFPADLMTSTASQPPHATVSTSGGAAFFSPKIEPSSVHSPIFMSSSAAASVMTNYGSTPDPSESFVSSDTCPETPDSSVKEEAEGLVNSPDTGSYVCLWMECNEEFVTQKSLVDHINDNHMETKKGCDEFPCLWKDCSRRSKAFNAKYKLITHMRVHTKEKPYLCTHENCNRAFARSENRKIHMRSHTGDKPFNCKYAQEFNCTKKFSNSSDRAKHEQTHKDPKPYKCEVLGCTKRYTDPSSLRKHVKSHSQEEQLQYRRSKDLANLAKRSASPTARYSTWTPASTAPTGSGGIVASATGNATADEPSSQQHHLLTSSSTLLQTGGTLLTVEDITASSSPGVPSPMQPPQRSAETTRSHGNYQGLAHQQNSLDDLDNDTIPFDHVPVRYDDSGLYEEMPHWSGTDRM